MSQPTDKASSYVVTPETVVVVCGSGATAAEALAQIASRLSLGSPQDVLLSAVTVFYTDGHYEAEVVVRTEKTDGLDE